MSEAKSEAVQFSGSLPLEIEREIFELAARIDGKTSSSLVRVSTYVSEWIVPILYEIVTIGIKDYKTPPTSLERYGHHVRHLLIGRSLTIDDIASSLVSCPNVTNLAIWAAFKLNEIAMEALKRLPLTRLSVHFDSVFDLSYPVPPQAAQLFSFFPQLTHLDVASNAPPEFSDSLQHLPRLTYLSVSDTGEFEEDWQDSHSPSEVLAALPHLKFLVFLRHNPDASGYYSPIEDAILLPESSESRQINLACEVPDFVDDWIRAARGETDVWAYVINHAATALV